MMKKLGIVVMTALFSVSVAGLSFADEKKAAAPAAPAVEKAAPAKATDDKAVTGAPKRVKPKMRMRKSTGTAVEAPIAAPAPAHTPEKK
jgi:hypothetical protein